MDFSFEDGLSPGQTGTVLAVATALVGGIVVAARFGPIDFEGAQLLMDAVLTLATLGYVFLTYYMVSRMKKDTELRERYQKRPHVIDRLETALLPLRYDIQRISRVLSDGEPGWSGPDGAVIDGETYRSYHEIAPGHSLGSIPQFTTHLTIDNGATFDVYQTAEQYSDTYQTAIYRLQELILAEVDDFPGDSEMVRDFAVLALKLEDGHSSTSVWDSYREQIVPLRTEIPDVMAELEAHRAELGTACHEALREIDSAANQTMQEYEISEGDLDPEQPPTADQVFTSGLHRRAGFDAGFADAPSETDTE